MLEKMKGILPTPIKREIRRILQGLIESIAYRRFRIKNFDRNISHIIFVCKGNICRSAFAEYYLQSIMRGESLRIESCGLDVDQGGSSPPDSVRIGYDFGVDLSQHQSKGTISCDLQSADLIIPMEYCQYIRLINLVPSHKGKIRLLRDFSPNYERLFCNIYDPFGLSQSELRRCFSSIQRALDEFKKGHLMFKKRRTR